ncbi:ankyrin repeat-containing protein-like [Dorcoceras hygrometricum]|uniref:Ankyrin repeat-containing protein-like n=1 Tax=Dorcoceras hygrometricum TaxID=472368 RepID=A0A2Z7AX28_9LAMI|nr:ankyrin repeat-containing protein-like [Dorcoceras hygrometricum]
MQGSDQPPVIALDLSAPATMAREILAVPPPGLGGSRVTNLASNRGLTREKQSLQVDAPAMLCRRDHLMVSAIVLSAPATNAGELLAGLPPGPGGSNETNHGPNLARTKDNERWEGDSRDMNKHTLRGVRHQAIGSTTIPPLRTKTSHS